MIIKNAVICVKEYFKSAITRTYLHFDLLTNNFVCLQKVMIKRSLIPIMIAEKNTTEYEILYFTNLIKQKWNLYEHDEIPEDILKKECNGCGNKQFGKIIPELVFHKCCNLHDYMYFLGGNKDNKKMSDRVFYFNMIRNSTTWWHKGVAFIYHYVVRHFGKDSFNYK